jgi:ribonuclease HII
MSVSYSSTLLLDNAIEKKRLKKLIKYEKDALKKGYKFIAGLDEVGRGCLAGPVVACACIANLKKLVLGVDDSKKLTPLKRRAIYEELMESDIIYALGIVEPKVIDEVNIYQATVLAMTEAVSKLLIKPDLLLVDGMNLKELDITSEKIIGGDALSYSIASASIIAKETRDDIMKQMNNLYPDYGFDQHKGYGTKQHLQAIQELGITPLHRKSFAPCKV